MNSKFKPQIFFLLFIVFVGLTVWGFYRLLDKNTRAQPDKPANTDLKSGQEMRSPAAGEGSQLPSGFPEDFPLYSQATLVNSWNAKGEQANGLSVVWNAFGKPAEIASYYKTELPAKNWQITSSFEQESSFTYSFTKGEINGFIGITEGEAGRTIISVTLGIK